MITVFHVLPVMGVLLGGLGGLGLGSRLGTVPGIICGVVGAGVGLLCGRIPLVLVLKSMKRDFSGLGTEHLRTLLRDPGCLAPNMLLLELGARGEDLERELPVVLEMLTDPSPERRMRGWHALESAFSSKARTISDYRIGDTSDECRRKIQRLIAQDSPHARSDDRHGP